MPEFNRETENPTIPSPQSHMLRDDPVIVLGMHHSGTSILAEVLHRNDIFMHGNMHHHESKFFTKLNDRVILGGGNNWARLPLMPVHQLMTRLEQVRDVIQKKARRKYMKDGYDGSSRWGFKDPRTCVALPLYLEIFPNSQLVHIIRNESDVAASLLARSKAGIGLVTDVNFWKELRRHYIDRVREYGSRHAHFFELEYERFCTNPVDVMRDVFRYLGCELKHETEEFLRTTVYVHRIGIGRNGAPR